MNQIIEFFKGLLAHNAWPARWHCGYWSDFHGWMYIISDVLIWAAYFAMPVIIVAYISKKKDAKFLPIYFLFAAFILACGTTHLLDAITFWYPMYRLSALVRLFTGIISWVTVYALIKVIPIAFNLKSSEMLQKEIDQRIKAETELGKLVKQLSIAQDIANIGHWEWNIKKESIIFSEGLLRLYGMDISSPSQTYSEFLDLIHPEDKKHVDEMIQSSINNKKFKEYQYRVITPNGEIKTFLTKGDVFAIEDGKVNSLIATAQDITEQKRIEYQLTLKSNNLEIANSELQKFAYVASHDLQEPLRKINTFGERLKAEFKDKLGDSGVAYLDKMLNASSRMRNLISDVLSFSQVSSEKTKNEAVNISDVFKQVLSDLEIVIEESKAKVNFDNLGVIEGNRSQIGQLFQNLVANSIKFRKPDAPCNITVTSSIITGDKIKNDEEIRVHYKFSGWNEEKQWKKEKFRKIVIEDNGVGFSPEYSNRIFVVFERLHTDSSYTGTGIGLAICKKIVENHRGVIQASGVENEGAIFTIILPISQSNFESNFGD